MHQLSTDGRRRLAVYLNDHRAGAAAGLAIARRCAGSTRDDRLAQYLTREFIPRTEAHRDLLDEARDEVGAAPSVPKTMLARAAAFAGRGKLNGHLRGRSPSTDIVELEALLAGARAKRSLWVVLSELGSTLTAEDETQAQIEALESHHRRLVEDAFGAEPAHGDAR